MEVVAKMQFTRNAFLCDGSFEPINQNQYAVREFNYRDAGTVCSWVTNQEMLSMVSGDIGNGLDVDILERWVETAFHKKAFVVFDVDTDKIVGFCTVSIKELPTIQRGYIELCHLIVNPEYCFSRYEIGLQLTSEAEYYAETFGFKYIIGRVVPSNNYANRLAKKSHWDFYEDNSLPESFNWYRKEAYNF